MFWFWKVNGVPLSIRNVPLRFRPFVRGTSRQPLMTRLCLRSMPARANVLIEIQVRSHLELLDIVLPGCHATGVGERIRAALSSTGCRG